MEEKKLTDEKIIKALEMHACNGRKYSFEEWDRCKTVTQSDILDLIHRLQSENAEQKAEIERLNLAVEGLTSVNNVLDKENTNVIAFNDALYREKTELQKQIDELNDLQFTKEHCDLYKENKWLKECLQQAVKDTAKEILDELDLFFKGTTFRKGYEFKKIDEKLKEIAKRKGVEVE